MAKKKSTKKLQMVQLTPKRYIETKCRQLPIEICLMGAAAGFVSIIVMRKMPSGKFIIGSYLLDTFCLGLKNTDFRFSADEMEADIYIDTISMRFDGLKPVTYVEAHNYVFGAMAYAEDLGLKPHKDFALTQYILEEDNDDIELIEYEFGRDGKPCYIAGPYDDKNKIIATLNRNVGEGNYDVVLSAGGNYLDLGDFDFDDLEEDDFDEDDFDEDDEDTEDTDFEIVEDKK